MSVAEVERVRRAIEELHVLRADDADHVDRGMKGLAPIFRMRLDVELDAFLLEDRNQLLHRAPPRRFARFGGVLSAATIGGMAAIGRRAAAELGIHGVDAHVDGDLDRLLPVGHRRLALVLVGARPAVHRQQRSNLHAVVLERLLEAGDALGVHARRYPPIEEIGARRELDPFVAEFGHLARQLLQRKMAMHVRVERDFHFVSLRVGNRGASPARLSVRPRPRADDRHGRSISRSRRRDWPRPLRPP